MLSNFLGIWSLYMVKPFPVSYCYYDRQYVRQRSFLRLAFGVFNLKINLCIKLFFPINFLMFFIKNLKFIFLVLLQWNHTRVTLCCSSVSILMRPLIRTACMEVALSLRVRSGLPPNGSMLGPLTSPRLGLAERVARMRMTTALNGLRMVNAKRTLLTWWVPRVCPVFAGRVAKPVNHRDLFSKSQTTLSPWIFGFIESR